MDEQMLIEMAQLEERVRAAARMVPRKGMESRCLETRSEEEFSPRSAWMMRLRNPTADCFAVELVPCDPDHPGSVVLHKEELPAQIRLDAHVLYELWMESLPMEVLNEVLPE